ncbi:hypothetical protein ACIHCX_28135 [Streptomyces sp. NPDC052043]|uniref:hypothetical protein n=1 Tax=Streptomyces sp. NPDC052043 TaxID=3365684 RepID=UPI0037D83E5C
MPATRAPREDAAPASAPARPPAPGAAHAVTELMLAGAAGAAVVLLPRARGATGCEDDRPGRRGRGPS